MQIVTRQQIREKVTQWQSGSITPSEIQSWASNLYLHDDVGYEDWEADKSVANEVLAQLDMLDMNLTTDEDSPALLDFLSTPIGDFSSGYLRLQDKLRMVDLEARKLNLRSIEPYSSSLI